MKIWRPKYRAAIVIATVRNSDDFEKDWWNSRNGAKTDLQPDSDLHGSDSLVSGLRQLPDD